MSIHPCFNAPAALSSPTCVVCTAPAAEDHHPARRRNHPDLVIALCKACHRLLGDLHSAVGLPAVAPEDQRGQAVLVGSAQAFDAIAARHVDQPTELARLGLAATALLRAADDSPPWPAQPARYPRAPRTALPQGRDDARRASAAALLRLCSAVLGAAGLGQSQLAAVLAEVPLDVLVSRCNATDASVRRLAEVAAGRPLQFLQAVLASGEAAELLEACMAALVLLLSGAEHGAGAVAGAFERLIWAADRGRVQS